jgi:hypothetical protein
MPLPRRLAPVRPVIALVMAVAVTIGTMSCAQAQQISPAFWGMHDGDWTSAPTVPVGSANFTVSGVYWSSVHTAPGTFDWTRLDEQVEAAEAIDARPMLILGRTPRFASTKPLSADYEDQMPELAFWREYVAAVAERYGTSIDYQIWPEPNIVQNWQGTPAQMAKPGGKPVRTFVDAVAIDPFPETRGTPEDSYRLMRSVRKQLASIKVRKPLWNNEINYGIAGGYDPSPVRLTVAKQQSYVIRTFALSAAAGMRRTYWLGWYGDPEIAVKMADEDGNALPPGKSYAVVREWLNRTNMRGCRQDRRGLWTCTATTAEETRRIYWKPSGKATIRIPRSALRIESQGGGVDASPGRRARVNFKPVMVATSR